MCRAAGSCVIELLRVEGKPCRYFYTRSEIRQSVRQIVREVVEIIPKGLSVTYEEQSDIEILEQGIGRNRKLTEDNQSSGVNLSFNKRRGVEITSAP